MKKLIRIAFPLLLLLCLFAAAAVTSSAAGLADSSYYDLWVGGVAVNPSNEENILGDGKVSFDPETFTLTLSGANIEGYVSKYDYLLSVYSESQSRVTVVIKGTTRLAHGIRLAAGEVKVENATLTVSDKAMTAFILYGENGNLTVSNSTVNITGSTVTENIRAVPMIYATNIALSGSTLNIGYGVDAHSVTSIVYATDKITAVSSEINIDQKIPSSYYALYANKGMSFTDSAVELDAPMYALYAPAGTVSLLRSTVEIDRGFFAMQAGGLVMQDSVLHADVFYDGIYIAAHETEDIDENTVNVKPTEVTFEDSEIKVTQLAYSRLKGMLSDLWDNMAADAKAEYGNNKETFLSQYQTGFAEETVFTAGLRGFCTSVSILRSDVELEKFTLGIYAIGTSTLYISDGSDVKLESERAAFVMFTNAGNAVTVSDKLRSSKDIYVTTVEGDLAALGGVLYTYSGKKPSLDLDAAYSEETPVDLFDALSGVSDSLHFYPRSSFVLWLVLGIVGGALLLGGIFTVILLRVILPRRRARIAEAERRAMEAERRAKRAKAKADRAARAAAKAEAETKNIEDHPNP